VPSSTQLDGSGTGLIGAKRWTSGHVVAIGGRPPRHVGVGVEFDCHTVRHSEIAQSTAAATHIVVYRLQRESDSISRRDPTRLVNRN
jgi:hypothetical protein